MSSSSSATPQYTPAPLSRLLACPIGPEALSGDKQRACFQHYCKLIDYVSVRTEQILAACMARCVADPELVIAETHWLSKVLDTQPVYSLEWRLASYIRFVGWGIYPDALDRWHALGEKLTHDVLAVVAAADKKRKGDVYVAGKPVFDLARSQLEAFVESARGTLEKIKYMRLKHMRPLTDEEYNADTTVDTQTICSLVYDSAFVGTYGISSTELIDGLRTIREDHPDLVQYLKLMAMPKGYANSDTFAFAISHATELIHRENVWKHSFMVSYGPKNSENNSELTRVEQEKMNWTRDHMRLVTHLNARYIDVAEAAALRPYYNGRGEREFLQDIQHLAKKDNRLVIAARNAHWLLDEKNCAEVPAGAETPRAETGVSDLLPRNESEDSIEDLEARLAAQHMAGPQDWEKRMAALVETHGLSENGMSTLISLNSVQLTDDIIQTVGKQYMGQMLAAYAAAKSDPHFAVAVDNIKKVLAYFAKTIQEVLSSP